MTLNEVARKLRTVVTALDEKKAVNMTILHIDSPSGYTDYMIFVTGTSIPHNKTLADNTLRMLKEGGFGRYYAEGEQNARWILLDAGSVIVQIMLDEMRDYYDLESIWTDAPRLDIKEILKSQ